MTTLNKYIINLLKNKLNTIEIEEENLKLLNKGKFANAIVYRYRDNNNDIDLTIKDFNHCPFIVRQTVGRVMPKIESAVLQKLQGIKGISPNVFLLSPYTIAFTFVKGNPLRYYEKKNEKLPVEFFVKLEEVIREMHSRNLVHLDLRNSGNIIRGEDGLPYLIDFQSSLPSGWMPKKFRKTLENSDISGVYKAWRQICEEPLPEDKEKFLEDFNNLRKVWVFRGYPIARAIRKTKKKFKNKK